MATKVCSKCKTSKPESDFHKNSQSRDGLKFWCKQCANGYSLRYHKDNPEKHRRSSKKWADENPVKVTQIRHRSRLRKYGLSPAAYDRILEMEGGACGICRRKAKLVIDHCHKTGQVRGLICARCNTLLGIAKDNPQVLHAASVYISSFTHK